MSEKLERAQAFTVLGEAYHRKMTETTLAAYEMGLSDISAPDVKVAVARAIRTRKFCPTPAELRELAGVGEDTVDSVALKAWATVDQAADSIGSYRSVDFGDPIINATIRSMGGWASILRVSRKEWDVWTRQSFLKAYASLSRSGVSDDAARPLPGIGSSGDVKAVNGTRHTIAAPEPVRVAVEYESIGSPSSRERKRVQGDRSRIPRLELRKP